MSIYRCIQGVSDDVINTYDSITPIDIVTNLKIVKFKPAPLTSSVNGFYKYISLNKQMIVINDYLSDEIFIFTLFHD